MKKERKNITLTEAASVLGLTTTTLKRWQKNGKITVAQDPITNARIFTPEDIDKIKAYILENPSFL